MNKKKAFSLIELSIVIILIGILIAGVTQGKNVIAKARLSSARALTESSPVNSIKGVAMWLETSRKDSFLESETDDGDQLTTWKDINIQSTSHFHALKPATSNVTYVKQSDINLLPAIKFDTTTTYADTFFTVATNSDPSSISYANIATVDFTIFIVLSTNSETTNHQYSYVFMNGPWDNEMVSYQISNSKNTRLWIRDVVQFGTANNTAILDAPHILVLDYDRANDLATIYINGEQVAQSAATENEIIGDIYFYIGSCTRTQYYWAGQMSEFIYYDHHLKNTERKDIEEYLGQKYKIGLVR